MSGSRAKERAAQEALPSSVSLPDIHAPSSGSPKLPDALGSRHQPSRPPVQSARNRKMAVNSPWIATRPEDAPSSQITSSLPRTLSKGNQSSMTKNRSAKAGVMAKSDADGAAPGSPVAAGDPGIPLEVHPVSIARKMRKGLLAARFLTTGYAFPNSATHFADVKLRCHMPVLDAERDRSYDAWDLLAGKYKHTPLYSWGNGGAGQLGQGHLNNVPRPTLFHDGDVFISLAAGTNHSAAVSGDGEVFTWGAASQGQLGLPEKMLARSEGGALAETVPRPTKLPFSPRAAMVSCGHNFTICLLESGDIYGWGVNSHKQLGHEFVKKSLVPVPNPALKGRKSIAVAAGFAHVVAISGGRDLWTWGCGSSGQLGHNVYMNAGLPRPVKLLAGMSCHKDTHTHWCSCPVVTSTASGTGGRARWGMATRRTGR
eukprot:jgi/Mesvir1/23181/Mv22650-RA.2